LNSSASVMISMQLLSMCKQEIWMSYHEYMYIILNNKQTSRLKNTATLNSNEKDN